MSQIMFGFHGRSLCNIFPVTLKLNY